MTQTLERSPQPTQPEIPAELRGLTLDKVEELREYQQELVNRSIANVSPFDQGEYQRARQSAYAQFGVLNGGFLNDHGIDENHPRRDEYLKYLNSFSLDAYPQSEWYAGRHKTNALGEKMYTDTGEPVLEPSGRDQLREVYAAFEERAREEDNENNDAPADQEVRQEATNTPEVTDEPRPIEDKMLAALEAAKADNPEIAAMLEGFYAKRDALAQITAKKIGKPVTLRGKKYKDARTEYDEALTALGRKADELREAQDEDRSDDDKRAEVIAFIFERQRELREKVNEIFQGTNVSKFLDKFGGWLARGNKATRIGKGVVVGAGAGLIGGTVGALGAAGAALGVAGVAATRFIKTYAQHDHVRGMDQLEDKDRDDLKNSLDHYDDQDDDVSAAVHRTGEYFEEDKKAEQKKRRKALGWAMGGVAVGAAAGAAYHTWADGDFRLVKSPKVTFPWQDDFGGVPGIGETGGTGTTDGNGGEGTGNNGAGGDTGNRANPPVEQPGETGTVTNPENIDYGTAAENIYSGEGWYNTFAELGVAPEQRDDLLRLVGPELVEQGIAYEDPSIGGYGINMTPSGEMPDEALRIIAETAHDNDISTNVAEHFDSSGDTTVDNTPADSTPNTADTPVGPSETLEPGDRSTLVTNAQGEPIGSTAPGMTEVPSYTGWTSEALADIGVENLQQQELLMREAGPKLLEQGVGYRDYRLPGDYGIRMTADGKMPYKAFDILLYEAQKNDLTFRLNEQIVAKLGHPISDRV